ncbi:hypothetical protein [Ruminococcus sp.]|uniref:hypothetical protein n=1 Tax=Ruminococcus sp. TaxID=41978 RepID=UPI0025ED4E56|nr:hypothetical protein [Ruminococcus sp.]
MIISENRKPPIEEFRKLMTATDELLNKEAVGREKYYSKRNGTDLEEDVYDALERCAIHTPFEGTIQLVSGASFPDIVANKYYGVEVKSTNKNHWKSIGSSILESTRNQNVERIYLTFGKLGLPIAFKSRPYEECLSGISVTHYPRYQIDMELKQGETIFDKMGIPYDTLRKMDNPVAPVSKYYKSLLKEGESLWWASDSDVESSEVPATVKLWSVLSPDAKTYFTVQGYALFPEILSRGNSKKYQRYALWLATNCGIINTNIRDQFSAGGQVDIRTINGNFEKMPAAFGRIKKNRDLIVETILTASEETLCEYWGVKEIAENRIAQWCQITASMVDEKIGYMTAYKLLCGIFGFAK